MIGVAIREAREIKGITQQDLARGSYLSYKTISAIETDKRPVTKENLKNICNELDDPRVYMEAISQICGDVFSMSKKKIKDLPSVILYGQMSIWDITVSKKVVGKESFLK